MSLRVTAGTSLSSVRLGESRHVKHSIVCYVLKIQESRMTGNKESESCAGTLKDSGSFSVMGCTGLIVKWIGSMTRPNCFMSLSSERSIKLEKKDEEKKIHVLPSSPIDPTYLDGLMAEFHYQRLHVNLLYSSPLSYLIVALNKNVFWISTVIFIWLPDNLEIRKSLDF